MRCLGQIGLALLLAAIFPAHGTADTHSAGSSHALASDLKPRFTCETDLRRETLTAVFPWLVKQDRERAIRLIELARAPINPLSLQQRQMLLEIGLSTLLCAKSSKLGVSTLSFLQEMEGDLDTATVASRYGSLLNLVMGVERLLQLEDGKFRRGWAEQILQRLDRERALAVDNPQTLRSGQYTVPLSLSLLRSAEAIARDEHDQRGKLPAVTDAMLALAKLDGRDRVLLDSALRQITVEDTRAGKSLIGDRVARLLEDRRSEVTALLTTVPKEGKTRIAAYWNITDKPVEIAQPSALTKYLEDSFKSHARVRPLIFKNLSIADRERMRAFILAFLASVEQDKIDVFAGKRLSKTERGRDRLYLKALLEHAVLWLDRPSADHSRLVTDPGLLAHQVVPWSYGELLKLEAEALRLAKQKSYSNSALTEDFDAFRNWMNANVHGGIPAQTRIDFYRLSPEERRLFVRILEGALPADIPSLLPLVYQPTGEAIFRHVETERPHINLGPKDLVLTPEKFVKLVREFYNNHYNDDVRELSYRARDLRALKMRRYLLEEALEGSAGVKALMGSFPHIAIRGKIPGASTEAERYYGRELQRSLRNLRLLSQSEKLASLPKGDKARLREYLEARLEELGRTIDELEVTALHDEVWHRDRATGKAGAEEAALRKTLSFSRTELSAIAQLLLGDKAKLERHGSNPLFDKEGDQKLSLSPEYWEKLQLEKDAAKREAQLKDVAVKAKAMPFHELADLVAYLKGGTLTTSYVQSELKAIAREETYARGDSKFKVYGLSLEKLARARSRLLAIQRLQKNWTNVKPVWDLVLAEARRKEQPVRAKKAEMLNGNPDRAAIYDRVGRLNESELNDLLALGRAEKGRNNQDLYAAVSDALRYSRSMFQDKLWLIRRLKDLKEGGQERKEEARRLEEMVKRLDERAKALGYGEALDDLALHAHDEPWELTGKDYQASLAKASGIENKIFKKIPPSLKLLRKNAAAQNLQFLRKKAYVYEQVSKLSAVEHHTLLSYLTNLRGRNLDQDILYEAVQDAIFLPPLGKKVTYPDGHPASDGFTGKLFSLKEMAQYAAQGNQPAVAAYMKVIRSIDAAREKAIGEHAADPPATAGAAEAKDAPGVRAINLWRYKRAALSGATVRLRLSSDPNLDADVLEYLAAVFHFSEVPKAALLNMRLEADVDYLPLRERWKVLNDYRHSLLYAFKSALAGNSTRYDHLLEIGRFQSEKSKRELLAFALGALIRMVDRALVTHADWADKSNEKLKPPKGQVWMKTGAELKFPALDADLSHYIGLLSRKPSDTPEERRFLRDLAKLRYLILAQPSRGRDKDNDTAVQWIFHGENTLEDFLPETVEGLRSLPEFARELLIKGLTDPKLVGTKLMVARLVLNPTTEGTVGVAWEDEKLRRILVDRVLMPRLEGAIHAKQVPALPKGISLKKALEEISDKKQEPPAALKDWLVKSLEGLVSNPDKQPEEPFRFKDAALAEALGAILQATERAGHAPKAGDLFARDKEARGSPRRRESEATSHLYVQEKKACDKASELQRYALDHFRRLLKKKTKPDVGVEGRLKLCSLGEPYVELMLLIEKRIPGLPGAAKKMAEEDLLVLAQDANPETIMKAGLAYAPQAVSYINSLPLEGYLRKAVLEELMEKATQIGEKGEMKPIELSAAAKSKLKLLTHRATMKLAGEALLRSQDPETQQAYQKLFHQLSPRIELDLRREAAIRMMSKAQDAVKAAKDPSAKKIALQKLLGMSRGLHNGLKALVLPSARLNPGCAAGDARDPVLLGRCLAEEMSFLTMELAYQEDFNGHLGEYLDTRKQKSLQIALGMLGISPVGMPLSPTVALIKPGSERSDKAARARRKYEDHLAEMMGDSEQELRVDAATYRDALRQAASTETWVETLKQILPGEEAEYKRLIEQSGRSEHENLKKPEFQERKHRLERLKRDLAESEKKLEKQKKNLKLAKRIYDSVNASTKDNLRKIVEEAETLLAAQESEEEEGNNQRYRLLGGDYLLYRLTKRQNELEARKETLQKQAAELRARNKPVPAEIQDEIRNLNLLSQNIAALQARLRAATRKSRLGPITFAFSADLPADSHVAAAGERFRKFEKIKDRGVKLARALILPSNEADAAHLDDPKAQERFLAKIKSDPATQRLYEGWIRDLRKELRLDEKHGQDLFLGYVRSVHPEQIASRDRACKAKIEALEAKYGMRWNGYMFDMSKAHLFHQKGDHTEPLTPTEMASLEKQMRATKECSSRKIDSWDAFRFLVLQQLDLLGYPLLFKFGDEMAVSVRIDGKKEEHLQFLSLSEASKQAQALMSETTKLWKELKELRFKLNALVNHPLYPLSTTLQFAHFCLEAFSNNYGEKEASRKWDERNLYLKTLKRLNEILTQLGKNIGKLGSYGNIAVDFPRELPTEREDAGDFHKITSYAAATELARQLGLLFLEEDDFREGLRHDLVGGAQASAKLLLALYVKRGLGEVAEAGWGSRLMQTVTRELDQTAGAALNGGKISYGGAWIQHFMDDPSHPSFRWSQYNRSQNQTMILFGAAHPLSDLLGLVKWLKPWAGMLGFGAMGAVTESFMGNPNHVGKHALRSALYAFPMERVPGIDGGFQTFLASFLYNSGLDVGFTYHEYRKMKEDAERDGMPLPPLETLIMNDLKQSVLMNLYFARQAGLKAVEEKRIEELKKIGRDGYTLQTVERSLGLKEPKELTALMARLPVSELKQMAEEAVHNREKAKAIEKAFGVPAKRLAERLSQEVTPWWHPLGPNREPAGSHLTRLRAEVAKSMAVQIADPKTKGKERDKIIREFLQIMPDKAYEHLPAFYLDETLSRIILKHGFKNASPGALKEFLSFYKALGHNQTDTLKDYVGYFDTRDPVLVRRLLSEGRLGVKEAYQFFDKGLVEEAIHGMQVTDAEKIISLAQKGGTEAKAKAEKLIQALAKSRGVSPERFRTDYRALMAKGKGDAALPVKEFAGKPTPVREKTLADLTREMSSTEAKGFRRFVEEAIKRAGDETKTIAQLAMEYEHGIAKARAAVIDGHTPVTSLRGRPEVYSDILLQDLHLEDPLLGAKHEAILRQVAEDVGLPPESLLEAAKKAPKLEMTLRRFAEALRTRQQEFLRTGLPDEAISLYYSEPWVYEQLGIGNFRLSENPGHQLVVKAELAARNFKGEGEARAFIQFVLDYKLRALHLTDDKQADVGPTLEHLIALYQSQRGKR